MKLKYFCDNCDDDLTFSSGTTKFRLTLSSKHLPHDNSPTMDIYIYPPIECDKHFCGLGCLEQWLEKQKMKVVLNPRKI